MNLKERAGLVAGWVLHVLIGGLLIFAGASKLFAPPEVVKGMSEYGLGDAVTLIGAGELITAVLLLIPRTLSLGILLISAFWGGVICLHMSKSEPYGIPSGLLLLSWLGAYLRHPETFSSFWRRNKSG